MLINVNMFTQGKQYPPISEQARIEELRENTELYNTDFTALSETWQRLTEYTGTNTPNMLFINYYKLISTKLADFLTQEVPKISGVECMDKFISNNDLYAKLYENIVDSTRYGTGVFLVCVKDGKGYIRNVNPLCWYPIVSPMDIKDIECHVLAWIVGNVIEGYGLYIQKHYKGYYIEEKYAYYSGTHGGIIGKLLETKTIPTGLQDFAVVISQAQTTTDTIYGDNEYRPIKNIIDEINEKLALASNILDRHSNPILTGPLLALNALDNGELALDKNRYFPSDNLEQPFSYITWDAKLAQLQDHIKMLIEQLGVVSELGPVILNTQNTGNVTAKALKLQYIGPLSKAQRYKKAYTMGLQKAISLALSIGWGELVEPYGITIEWQDGLPADYAEDIAAEVLRVNNNLSTLADSIVRLDNCTKEQAIEKVKEIKQDRAINNI